MTRLQSGGSPPLSGRLLYTTPLALIPAAASNYGVRDRLRLAPFATAQVSRKSTRPNWYEYAALRQARDQGGARRSKSLKPARFRVRGEEEETRQY